MSSEDPRLIDEAELRRRLPMREAIDALEIAFRSKNGGGAPLRTRLETPAGELYLMPASGEQGVGVKLVTLTPANPPAHPLLHAVYVLFAPDTQAPIAVIDGAALTALRTAAVSGLATRFLTREDSHDLVIFGAGVQARAHLEAMRAVRTIERLVVVSRSPERAALLVTDARATGLEARVGTPEDASDADLICTCTTSEQPLFDGATLREGTHVNAIGAYRPDARELDTATMVRARVVVEKREVAFAEAGDLLIPIMEGAIDRGHVVADLGEVVEGASVRRSPAEVTVFKSVGMAFEDLAVATAVVAE